MNKQKEREERIYSKLKLEKLPFKLTQDNFKILGNAVSSAFQEIYNIQVKSEQLKWTFSTVKRFKIFLEIFYANEKGEEIYKEEIAKKIPEYSYKTISKIINDGRAKGIYIALKPDGESGTDNKIKNIRPSEELMTDFLNLSINIFSFLDHTITKNKT
jgi:virulence-associated protein VapD